MILEFFLALSGAVLCGPVLYVWVYMATRAYYRAVNQEANECMRDLFARHAEMKQQSDSLKESQ